MTAQILGFGPEVDVALSLAIGGAVLAILLALMVALVAFGGGREHS
ncbi:MAG TPA: hypothetical protein PLZ93_13715 [Nocardioides sp.]|nr:hypothetical protein [uncultured Nocardioides sp.]HRD63493.1 hypothetical protein [Nocardioides sp.]HRI96667.1 hypothetical protein [Nocardioides sp.]HRK46559.1 hypothetical protein [Nocardioides sp.]